MRFQYVLEYRDEKEAAAARFAGEPVVTPGAEARRPALGWAILIVAIVLAAVVCTLASPRRGARPLFITAAREADQLDNPVFAAGFALAGLGACVFAIPLAFLIGRQRSALPINADPVTVMLDEAGMTLRSKYKEFELCWDGVVAVAELKNVFVLKTIGDLRLTLPKRALQDQRGVAALREVLRHYVPPMAEVARRLAA